MSYRKHFLGDGTVRGHTADTAADCPHCPEPHGHSLDDIVGYRIVRTVEAGELVEPKVLARFEGAASYAETLEARRVFETAGRRRGVFCAIDRHYVCGCWSVARSDIETSIGSR